VSHIQTLQPAEFAQGDALPVPVFDRLLGPRKTNTLDKENG
jgi:hypothetical protein